MGHFMLRASLARLALAALGVRHRPSPNDPQIDSADTALMICRHGVGADDDDAGPGAVLCRHGAQEECAGDHGAKPRRHGHRLDSLAGRSATPSRSAATVAWPARSIGGSFRASADGPKRQRLAKTIPECCSALSDDLRDHHRGAGRRRDRRPDEVLGLLLFCASGCSVVYIPSAHWVWGGGFLGIGA